MIPVVSSLVGSNRALSSSDKTSEAPTAAERRALSDVVVSMAAPLPATKGLATRGGSIIHVVVKNKDAAGTFDFSLYGRHEMSGEWVLITQSRPGVSFSTAGVWSIAAGLSSRTRILHIEGIERVYPRVFNLAGTVVNGADVWLGTVGGFRPAER